MKYYKSILVTIAVVVLILIFLFGKGRIISKEYNMNRKDDGYSITIKINKQYLISADGIFSRSQRKYKIDLLGHGENWNYRNQEGYYYSFNHIDSSVKIGDLGYAWVNSKRNYLYLNLYWVSSPDNLIPSDINGKYRLNP